MTLSPGQRLAQDDWRRAERERILAPDPPASPVEVFASACGELLAALVYCTDRRERQRIADLLQAVCTEANRLAAKREAA